jgi:hypothetical protein
VGQRHAQYPSTTASRPSRPTSSWPIPTRVGIYTFVSTPDKEVPLALPLQPDQKSTVKLSEVVNAIWDHKLIPINDTTNRAMYARYRSVFGMDPPEDTEPTPDQIAAIKMLDDLKFIPGVDFSLFGPHGRRAMKKLTYAAQMWDPETQTYKRRDLPGPQTSTLGSGHGKSSNAHASSSTFARSSHSTPTATRSVLSTKNTARSIGSLSSRRTRDSEKNPLNDGSAEKRQQETAQKSTLGVKGTPSSGQQQTQSTRPSRTSGRKRLRTTYTPTRLIGRLSHK